jgi:hypothetical protein
MPQEGEMVQGVRRLTIETGVEHRQEDIQEEISCVLDASAPIPTEDKKIDGVEPTPLDKAVVGTKEGATGYVDAAIRHNAFPFRVNVSRKHRQTGRVEEKLGIKPNSLEGMRWIREALEGSHQLRPEPAREQKDRLSFIDIRVTVYFELGCKCFNRRLESI